MCVCVCVCVCETCSHQLSLNSEPASVLQAKAASGSLSGCFQIFVKLKSITKALNFGVLALICSEKLNKYV